MVEQASHNRQATGSNPVGAKLFSQPVCLTGPEDFNCSQAREYGWQVRSERMPPRLSGRNAYVMINSVMKIFERQQAVELIGYLVS